MWLRIPAMVLPSFRTCLIINNTFDSRRGVTREGPSEMMIAKAFDGDTQDLGRWGPRGVGGKGIRRKWKTVQGKLKEISDIGSLSQLGDSSEGNTL